MIVPCGAWARATSAHSVGKGCTISREVLAHRAGGTAERALQLGGSGTRRRLVPNDAASIAASARDRGARPRGSTASRQSVDGRCLEIAAPTTSVAADVARPTGTVPSNGAINQRLQATVRRDKMHCYIQDAPKQQICVSGRKVKRNGNRAVTIWTPTAVGHGDIQCGPVVSSKICKIKALVPHGVIASNRAIVSPLVVVGFRRSVEESQIYVDARITIRKGRLQVVGKTGTARNVFSIVDSDTCYAF